MGMNTAIDVCDFEARLCNLTFESRDNTFFFFKNEMLNSFAIKCTPTQFSTLRAFVAQASLGPA